jgi:AcrR family transcriptional regulator
MVKLEQDNQLRQHLIETMIRHGAVNVANKGIATATIAEECGVSEFMVFSYFGSKEGLISECLAYCWRLLAKAALSKDPDHETMEELLNRLMDFAFAHPAIMGFVVNYCPGFSRAVDDQNPLLKETMSSVVAKGSTILKNFDLGSRASIVWFSLVRESIYDANSVSCGLAKDTPSYRKDCLAILSSGLSAFLSEKEGI